MFHMLGRRPGVHCACRLQFDSARACSGSATRIGDAAAQVFEARLPLGWDAALTLGCCASVAPHATRRPLGETFSLTDLSVGSHLTQHILSPCVETAANEVLWNSSPRLR